MKILYIHQYFRTPEEGGCTRSYHLAKGLVENGYEVEIITAHNGRYECKDIDGIHVRYLPVAYSNKFGFLRRIFAFLKYVRSAIKESKKIQRIDLAYVMTTPLTTGLIALNLKKSRNIPYCFEVGDLWPEAPIQMGAIKNSIFKSILYRFERKCYFEAQKIVALSPAIRNYIEKVSPVTKVFVIPNLAHCSYYEHKISIKKHGHESPFRIGYIGTIGRANHLTFLVNVARESIKKNLPLEFHIMGEGGEARKIKKSVSRLSNVIIHDFGPTSGVKTLIEKMDAVYVSFKNIPVLNTGSPNKFFDGLASGKLIIINFEGWIKDVIESNKCGFTYTPQKPKQFLKRIKPYLESADLLLKAQQNSRRVAETFYDKELLVKKLLKVLNNEQSIMLDDSEIYILTA
ncbi:MAG: glycosyltransferase involved in cell wall biosynthesis [Cyclobacteriaceae bacterium]|jgi:glycosyltransferase involved in cell wall biosynthesis